MWGILGGVVGFILFILYDINTVVWKKKCLYGGFTLGCIFLGASTVLLVIEAISFSGGLEKYFLLFLCLTLIFFILLIYTLFFALPFRDTYQDFKEEPRVCDTGLYALCRHPGVLWFFFFYLFLGLAFVEKGLLAGGMVFSACNLIYVLMQDAWSFPKQFKDYEKYKKEVPFLIPTPKSINRCFHTLRR